MQEPFVNPDQTMCFALTGYFFLFGSFLGSFCNVVILRMASGLSVIFPPSRCPTCGHRLSALDLIPVLGWLLLGGRCRYCRVSISWQYPVIEGAVAFLLGTAFFFYGFSPRFVPSAALSIFWLITAVLVLRGEVTSPLPAVYAWLFLVLFGVFLGDGQMISRHLIGLGIGVFLSLGFFLRHQWLEGFRWVSLIGFSSAGVWPLLGPLAILPLALVALSHGWDSSSSSAWEERSRHLFFLTQITFLVLLSVWGVWPR